MDRDAAAGVTTTDARRGSNALAVFSVAWAAATLFHVWGPSRRAEQLLSHVTVEGAFHALAGIAAVAMLLRPRRLEPLIALAVLGPITLWYEAPFLGSHWVVAALVDIALLLAVVAAPLRQRRLDEVFFPLARWVLVGFYSFAAFAKLNHAFFTPEVSCGTYYFDELAGSLGFTVHSQAGGAWTHLVPFGVAGIECSIPVLLSIRRTRSIGVLVGLLFHGLIALDQTHLFSDFSSVLVALFVLFLPASFADSVVDGARRIRVDVRLIAAACSAALLVLLWYGEGASVQRLFADGIGWAWVVYWLAALGLAMHFVWRVRATPLEHPLRFDVRWLAVVPVLVLATGLTPYLELRTAYAFNMYSNLQTVDGASNHLIVTRTLPLTDFQSDLVRIVDSNDSTLRLYATQRFDLAFIELRAYLSEHPDVSLTYVRHGVEHSVAHARDDRALVEPVPDWEQKMFAFRSVDQTSPARCQPSFLPAL